jgi:hypothetical protein
MLLQWMEGRVRREVIIGVKLEKPRADEYGKNANSEEFSRMVAIPLGMTIADGLRAVGGCTEEELADPKLQVIVDCAEIWSFLH